MSPRQAGALSGTVMTHGSEPTPEPVFPGGRRAAEARLARIDPARYAASRNHLDGAVTRLSPYIRHGVLTLAEVRETVFAKLEALGAADAPASADAATATATAAAAAAALQGELFAAAELTGSAAAPSSGSSAANSSGRRWSPAQRRAGEKLIHELGWRDYWQRLWSQLGDGIWLEREPLKTGHAPESYAPELPADLAAASTGLACIDGFATELMETGWLHNHARMWLAAYVVHWRRVRWQAGARWFLTHLLDGDPASNNLSWQWVASSFSHKPYIFNRSNLERFSSGRHCNGCPRASGGGAASPAGCPFEASYEALQAQLFRPHHPRAESGRPPQSAGHPVLALPSRSGPLASPHSDSPHSEWQPSAPQQLAPQQLAPQQLVSQQLAGQQPPLRPLLWVHAEALGPSNPALLAHPAAPAVFVFDGELLAGRTPSSGGHPAVGGAPVPLAAGRLRFLRECLAELPVQLRQGDVAAELLAAAAQHGCDGIVTSRAVDPRFASIAARLTATLPLRILEPEPFVELPLQGPGSPDLGRFSRYWRRAEPLVWGELIQAGGRRARRPRP